MRLTSLYAVKAAHPAAEPARPTVVAVTPDAPPLPSSGASRCIFDEDWWLDAAAPGGWDRARVEWDGEVVGDMAYAVHRRRLFTYIAMPHLTRTMSPRLAPPPDKPARERVHRLAIMEELLRQLPRHDRFERALDVGCPSVQGFIHAGFPVTHAVTLRTPAGVSPQDMLASAHRKTRQAIVRGGRECSVQHSGDLDRFIRFHRRAYGGETSVDYTALARIFEAARSRRVAEIIFLEAAGEDIAAFILVWDSRMAYTWVIARDEKRNATGAFNLLMYEAALAAWRLDRILDVDGYVRPAVGAFLTKFGFDVEMRPFVNGSSPLWRCYHLATTLIRSDRYDRSFRIG